MKKIVTATFALCLVATIIVGAYGTNFVKNYKIFGTNITTINPDNLSDHGLYETIAFGCPSIWSDIKNPSYIVKNHVLSTTIYPPDPPSDFRVEAINSWEINLTWQDNSDNEMGFKVYRKMGLVPYKLISTLDKNATTYQDTVLPEISYKYKVSAYNDAGEFYSQDTNIVSLAQPTAFEITAFTSNSISISWKDNSNYEEGYEIYRKISIEETYALVATMDANKICYEDTDLINCTTYDYLVNAYGEQGKSTSSFYSGTTPLPPGETVPSTLIPLGDGNYSGSICCECIEETFFNRTFRIHVPSSYDGSQLTPVVLNFHGRLGHGEDAEKQSRMTETSDANGFIVVYPNGLGRSWNDGRFEGKAGFAPKFTVDDVGFVSSLIDFLENEFSIDTNRIYSTGMSNGARFSYRLASELSMKIAAVAPVAGSMNQNFKYDPQRPLSVMQFHGTADTICPWDGGEDRTGSLVCSVQDTINFWIDHNACNHTSSITYQKGDTTCYTYGQGKKGTEVVLCVIEGGGHTWPGGVRECSGWSMWLTGKMTQNISASDAMWDFFVKHPLYVEEPLITIAKPKEGYLYLFDKESIPLVRNTIVVGKITIEVEAYDEDGIDKVAFYVDNVLSFSDYNEPYSWTWNKFAIGNHEIKVIAYDVSENKAEDKINVIIFNFGG